MRRKPLTPASTPHPDQIPKFVFENVDELVRARAHMENQMGFEHRLADQLTNFLGSIGFLSLQILFIASWIVANSGLIRNFTAFDPYPFSLLSGLVAVEAILLTTIVLISQNRTQDLVERRDELNLHVSLLIEKETTSILKKFSRLEQKLHIAVDETEQTHVHELLKETTPVELASSIELTTQNVSSSQTQPSSKRGLTSPLGA